jgi:hypothetical protein
LQGLPPCPWCEHCGRWRAGNSRRALRLISVRLTALEKDPTTHRLVPGVGPRCLVIDQGFCNNTKLPG